MKAIDEEKLETDLVYRYEYLAEFIGFTSDDVAAIRAIVGKLGPEIPQIVASTYEQLLQFDATARHFLPRQHGFEGEVPVDLASLSLDEEQIKFRREHLTRYLMNLLGHSYQSKISTYLDIVGKMHTPKAGNKSLDVPLVQMNALMGKLSDVLIDAILGYDIDSDVAQKAVRAFSKLLWIQNDFIVRHYAS